MVQIPQYTRRETFNATERPKANLNLPDAIARSASGGQGIQDIKAIAKGGEVIANTMLEMKETYDKARANEYINNYMRNAQQTILGYKKDRVGRFSDGVVSDFEEWSEKEFNNAMGTSENSSVKPLLENKEQIELARQQMDKLNLNYYTELSSFQAKEQQKYADNQAAGVIQNLAVQLSTEQNEDEILNTIASLNEKAYEISTYKGQSPEYVSKITNPIISSALSQNIMATAIEYPDYSIMKMEQDIFKNNMSEEDKKNTKDALLKSFKEYYAEKLSDDIAYTLSSERPEGIKTNLDKITNRPFFDGVNTDLLIGEIINSAQEKSKVKETKRLEASVDLINNATINISNNGFDPNSINENTASLMLSVQGGKDTFDLIKILDTNKAVYLSDDIPEEISTITTKEHAKLYSDIRKRIDDGYYRILGEMKDDIISLPYPLQSELVGQFTNNLKFKKDVLELKKTKGIDIESKIDDQFYAMTGLTNKNSPNIYREFRNKVVDGLRGLQLNGKKIEADDVVKISNSVTRDILNPASDEMAVLNILKGYEEKIAKEYTSKDTVDLLTRMSEAKEIFEDSDISDLFDKDETEDAFVEFIINGDVDAAVGMIKDRRAYMFKKIGNESLYRQRTSTQKALENADYLWYDPRTAGFL